MSAQASVERPAPRTGATRRGPRPPGSIVRGSRPGSPGRHLPEAKWGPSGNSREEVETRAGHTKSLRLVRQPHPKIALERSDSPDPEWGEGSCPTNQYPASPGPPGTIHNLRALVNSLLINADASPDGIIWREYTGNFGSTAASASTQKPPSTGPVARSCLTAASTPASTADRVPSPGRQGRGGAS